MATTLRTEPVPPECSPDSKLAYALDHYHATKQKLESLRATIDRLVEQRTADAALLETVTAEDLLDDATAQRWVIAQLRLPEVKKAIADLRAQEPRMEEGVRTAAWHINEYRRQIAVLEEFLSSDRPRVEVRQHEVLSREQAVDLLVQLRGWVASEERRKR